jgi:2,6-dihydroxypyridine 3-monooxygenase
MGTRPIKVIVMGGSLGGLSAALFLRQVGCTVTVYERAPLLLGGLGAGIVLNPATVRYFTSLGDTRTVQDISVATPWVRYLAAHDQIVAQLDVSYRFSSYNAIYKALLAAFGTDDYHLGAMVTGFEQDEHGVTVQLATGHSDQCDLLVCADGITSAARASLLENVSLEYAGYVAWRGVLSEQDISAAAFTCLHDAVVYHVLPQGHVLTYPIPVVDRTPGERQIFVNWLWYKNVNEGPDLASLMTDQGGIVRDVSLKPGAVRGEHIATLRQAGVELLPPLLSDLISRTEQPFIQAVMDCYVPRMAFGRVCLMGDAAFVARPHAAAGTAKAAEDGWQLSQALVASGWDIEVALQQWESNQLEVGRKLVERSRQAGYQLQNGTWPVGSPLAFGLYETGDSEMT